MRGANVTDSRAMAEAINRRNAEVIARADEAVGLVWRAIALTLIGIAGGWFLAEYFTPCASAAHLCMGVVGLHTRRSPESLVDEATALQGRVLEVVEGARAAGELDGHRLGFIEGTRHGMWVGCCWGLVCGVLLMVGALKLGLLAGYL